MSTPAVLELRGTATVELGIDKAFTFFTESFRTWWPSAYHIGQSDLADAIIEPWVGGRWYERGADGAECGWGWVQVWEPLTRLVVTWQINGYWQYDPDPRRASEIEIRFTEDELGRTAVTVEHRHLDRLVEGKTIHDTIAEQGGGWSTILELFAKAAQETA
ncbi:SRPBCC family protein [Nocardia colli]|uniref:SRPBCC family protein n=1 Tax=Nocardia colli TaxID=2545717 RepID=UPI0035DC5B56